MRFDILLVLLDDRSASAFASRLTSGLFMTKSA
jgi:hypothetical protein